MSIKGPWKSLFATNVIEDNIHKYAHKYNLQRNITKYIIFALHFDLLIPTLRNVVSRVRINLPLSR